MGSGPLVTPREEAPEARAGPRGSVTGWAAGLAAAAPPRDLEKVGGSDVVEGFVVALDSDSDLARSAPGQWLGRGLGLGLGLARGLVQ